MREQLSRKYFANDVDYEKYVKTYEANSGEEAEPYSKAVMDLITMFIEEQSCDDEIVKQSEHYKQLSGAQVAFARGYFEQHYTLLEENE